MAARVKIVKIPRNVFHALKVVLHDAQRQLAHAFVCRGGVERVRRMCQNFSEAVLRSNGFKLRNIFFADFLCRKAARITREKLKRVRTYRNGFLCHVREAL